MTQQTAVLQDSFHALSLGSWQQTTILCRAFAGVITFLPQKILHTKVCLTHVHASGTTIRTSALLTI